MIYDSNLNCNTISCQNTAIWYLIIFMLLYKNITMTL